MCPPGCSKLQTKCFSVDWRVSKPLSQTHSHTHAFPGLHLLLLTISVTFLSQQFDNLAHLAQQAYWGETANRASTPLSNTVFHCLRNHFCWFFCCTHTASHSSDSIKKNHDHDLRHTNHRHCILSLSLLQMTFWAQIWVCMGTVTSTDALSFEKVSNNLYFATA